MPFGIGILEMIIFGMVLLILPAGGIAAAVYGVLWWDRRRRETDRIERQEFLDELEERLVRRLGPGGSGDDSGGA